MIDYETYARIRHYKEKEGLTPIQIADSLSLDIRTVLKWVNEKHYQSGKREKRSSKLDPFKNDIVRMLERHSYSAVQIYQRIKEDGFEGGYTIVKDYVHRVRPAKTKAYLKLSFAPGECAQVDWGSYGSVNVGSTIR